MEKNTKTATRKNGSNRKASNHNGSTVTTASHTMDEKLEKLFVDQLRDIYYAEKLLVKALPKMAKAATSEELKEALEDHKVETQGQVERLEQIFDILGKRAQGKKCEAMDGLHKEAESIVEETDKGSLTRDVGIIMASQKIEHYEIATYGCLAQLANTFNMGEVATLLQETLEEEKEADKGLTYIAENNINYEAGQEDEEDEEE